jgi:Lhr-like helicase
MATKRKKIDWEAIEREYRAGVLSIREIARQFKCTDGAIRNKAKKYGWQRDLSEKVRKRAQQKLLRKNVRTSNADDESIIEEASNRIVAIQRLQRKDINALRELEASLISEIKGSPTKLYITQYQGQIIEKPVDLTAAERSQAANNLANVQHKRIALERQAYGMDDGDSGVGLDELIGLITKKNPQVASRVVEMLRDE